MRLSVIVLSAWLAAAASPARADVTFLVRDRLATDEVEELTALYIDGQLIRSFRLGETERDVTVTVTVSDPGAHEYGLCGHLKLREPDGTVREQAVEATGTLSQVDGRAFEAVASSDFTRFFLVDTTEGRPAATITARHGRACVPAVS